MRHSYWAHSYACALNTLLLISDFMIKLDTSTQPRGVHHDSSGHGHARRYPVHPRYAPERQAEGSSCDTRGGLWNQAMADVARATSETTHRSARRRLAAAIHHAPPRRTRIW